MKCEQYRLGCVNCTDDQRDNDKSLKLEYINFICFNLILHFFGEDIV